MGNLIVTEVCNLSCACCFARDTLAGDSRAPDAFSMALETFDGCLEFLQRSGIQQARLLGGEPTLHPRFLELVERVLARRMSLMVFSNGMAPAVVVERLAALPAEACQVMLNATAAQAAPPAVARRQREFLMRLGPRCRLGANIDRVEIDLAPLLALIAETGCNPLVRLGLAHPTRSGSNRSLSPKQYPLAGRKILEFARQAARAGVRVDFDCGFVPCMFHPDHLQELQSLGAQTGWHCGAIPDIDIHGAAFHCFPLADRPHLPLAGFQHMPEVIAALNQENAPFRQVGIYPDCTDCLYHLDGVCQGGCLAGVYRRFRSEPFRVRRALAEELH